MARDKAGFAAFQNLRVEEFSRLWKDFVGAQPFNFEDETINQVIFGLPIEALNDWLREQAKKNPVGKRIELHPGCDLWMRGARYGEVVGVEKDGTLKIKMDHPSVRKLVRLPPDRVTFR